MNYCTLEPHYNAHFGVHSDMSVITEQHYNEGLIHRKYIALGAMPVGCYKQMSTITEGVVTRLQCTKLLNKMCTLYTLTS